MSISEDPHLPTTGLDQDELVHRCGAEVKRVMERHRSGQSATKVSTFLHDTFTNLSNNEGQNREDNMLDTRFRARTETFGELTSCARCGETLVAPTWSEHVSERCVRHLWECEACGYKFETAVYFQARAA